MLGAAEKQTSAIAEMHTKLLTGSEGSDSIQEEVNAALIDVRSSSTDATNLLKQMTKQTKDLHAFHEKIFGTPDAETNEMSGGLNNELNLRMKALADFETAQSTKHKVLIEKIEL